MPSRGSSHFRGCVLYFFLQMSLGCVLPYLPLIWSSKGLSDHQIGLVRGFRRIGFFVCAPVICSFADRHAIERQVLNGAMVLFSICRPSVLIAAGFMAVGAVEVLCSVFESPIPSIVDAAVRHSHGGDGYGRQRLRGAIGYGVATLGCGYVYDSTAANYTGVMAVFVVAAVVTLAVSTGISMAGESEATSTIVPSSEWPTVRDNNKRLELHPAIEQNKRISGGSKDFSAPAIVAAAPVEDINLRVNGSTKGSIGNLSDKNKTFYYAQIGKSNNDNGRADNSKMLEDEGNVRSALRVMLETLESASFFAAMWLSGIASGVIETFLFVRLVELGGSHVLCGMAQLIMCIAEVPFFYVSGPLIRTMGARGVVVLAQMAYVVRFAYYSFLRKPWWVLPAEVLHGLTFAALWSATTDCGHDIAPAHLRTTIQGIGAGLYWGLGFGLGAMFGGILYARLGARLCVRVCTVLPLFSLLVLALPKAQYWYINGRRHFRERMEAPGQSDLDGRRWF